MEEGQGAGIHCRRQESDGSRRWSGEMEIAGCGVVKWLGHHSSAQTILVVGDGDLSFSLALATAFDTGDKLVATSLDTYDTLTTKYGNAKSNVTELKRLGATVLHCVDAKTMKHHRLNMRGFDRIVFNFPHAGFIGKESDDHIINAHQLLVRGFFLKASHMLRPDGEIHVSHNRGQYYRWKIPKLASECSLVMVEIVAFRQEDYPGYNRKRGYGDRCDEEFPLSNGWTSKFRVGREEAEDYTISTAAQREGEKKMSTLKSSDCEEFEVEEAVAMESQTIRYMIEDDYADKGILHPNVNSKILYKVIEYYYKHVHATATKPANSEAGATTDTSTAPTALAKDFKELGRRVHQGRPGHLLRPAPGPVGGRKEAKGGSRGRMGGGAAARKGRTGGTRGGTKDRMGGTRGGEQEPPGAVTDASAKYHRYEAHASSSSSSTALELMATDLIFYAERLCR